MTAEQQRAYKERQGGHMAHIHCCDEVDEQAVRQLVVEEIRLWIGTPLMARFQDWESVHKAETVAEALTQAERGGADR